MARDPFPSETQDRFLVRLPNGMRDRLKAAAEANKRSMNAEIVARLDRSLGDNAVNEFDMLIADKSIRYAVARGLYQTLMGIAKATEEARQEGRSTEFADIISKLTVEFENAYDEEINEDVESLASGVSRRDVEISRRQKTR